MADLITGIAPVVEIKANGTISWNAATQTRLGDPRKIELFHDTEAGRLGLRRLVNIETHMLPVIIDADGYYVEAGSHLDEAGIEIRGKLTVEPSAPEPLIPRSELSGCIWVDLS